MGMRLGDASNIDERRSFTYTSSEIRGDDGVLSLCGLGGHAQVEWVYISLTNSDLWIPVRIAGTNSKVVISGIPVVVPAWIVSWVVRIQCSVHNIKDF